MTAQTNRRTEIHDRLRIDCRTGDRRTGIGHGPQLFRDRGLPGPALDTEQSRINTLGISIENDLLMVNGEKKNYQDVYRKVQAVTLDILAKESIAAEEWGEDWRAS